MPWLCPAVCSYLIHPLQYDNGVYSSWEEIEDFIQQGFQTSSNVEETLIISRALRVSDYDAEGNFLNRHAHTYVVLVIDKSARTMRDIWKSFQWNLKIIEFLYARRDIPLEITQKLEKFVWRYAGCVRYRLVRMTKKITEHITPKLAETMLAPDYVWRTGRNAGRTTMDILKTKWGQHHMLCM